MAAFTGGCGATGGQGGHVRQSLHKARFVHFGRKTGGEGAIEAFAARAV